MTLNAAMKRLKRECDFLGVEWDRLVYLLRTNPLMFPQGALNAYDVWLESIDHVIEDRI